MTAEIPHFGNSVFYKMQFIPVLTAKNRVVRHLKPLYQTHKNLKLNNHDKRKIQQKAI